MTVRDEGARRLRLLFVSGESAGGAPRSTIELSRRLVADADVSVVLGDRTSAPPAYDLLRKLAVKLGGAGIPTVMRAASHLGRRSTTSDEHGVRILRTSIAVNCALVELADRRPDVVIANSLPRIEMQLLHDRARALGVPFAIYAREEHAVSHFAVTGLRPDLALANSRTLTEQIAFHHPCTFVPSIVERDERPTRNDSARDVLCVNPVLNRSVFEIAPHCPDNEFLLQESWPMETDVEAEILARVKAVDNVRFRRRVPGPDELFGTAALLLITAEAGRPRIVVEAQARGIPVVAPDLPALREVVGNGGLLYSPTATAAEIAGTLRRACDPAVHRALSDAAQDRAASDERDPDAIARRFAEAVANTVERRTQ